MISEHDPVIAAAFGMPRPLIRSEEVMMDIRIRIAGRGHFAVDGIIRVADPF